MTRNTLITGTFLTLASLFTAGNAMAGNDDKPFRGNVNHNANVGVDFRGNNGGFGIQIGNNRGHDHIVTERVWVPARYEERHTQVLVEPAHYEERHTQVLVHAGHWDTRVIPAQYKTVRERHGNHYHERQVLVCAARTERFWHPDKYETRCEKILVPARYETRCEKVLIPGHYEDVQRVIHHHDNRQSINIRVGGRDW